MTTIKQPRYRMPLCPYLAVGNRKVLVSLDAYGVPQSLQWPKPGWPDRLGWRDSFDEWPYWEEMSPDAICARMPYFEYADGTRNYLHEATDVAAGYVDDTNVLQGRYALPGGALVELQTFVPPTMDVWVRHFRVKGEGRLVLQSEFFEKAVRGHALAHMGNISFRGAFDGPPRGVYVILSTLPLQQALARVEVTVSGEVEWTMFMSMAPDLRTAVTVGEQALGRGFAALRDETIAADRTWVSGAKEPVSRHPFVLDNYKRWLLSNLLVSAPDGAMVCGPRPFWGFAWPRDGSMQIAAFAAAGFVEEARRALAWHLDHTPTSGIHEARYFNDGTPVLLDNRPRQGDNPGFLCWAAAFVCRASWDAAWARAIADKLYVLADHLVNARDEETLLPLPEADHREGVIAESMGIIVTAIGGLKGAAEIAGRLGDAARVDRYLARAAEIKRGAEQCLWDPENQYFNRSVKPFDAVPDIGFCWGVYPMDAWKGDDPKAVKGVERIVRERWNESAGGVLGAPGTPYESYWMYYTAILLLGVAGIGNQAMEGEILASLARNVSPQGLIPEQVGRATGNLWGCAFLPVAQADLLLYAYRPA